MAKKTFKENPALQFISNAEDTPNTDDMSNEYNTHNTDNTHNKHNTHNTQQERKTKRLNLLLKPSTLEDLSKIAYIKKTSTNNLINSILQKYIEIESAAIIKYNETFEK